MIVVDVEEIWQVVLATSESSMELIKKVAIAEIVPIEENMSRCAILMDALCDVIRQERFDGLTTAETVGVLEFIKWNIINRS